LFKYKKLSFKLGVGHNSCLSKIENFRNFFSQIFEIIDRLFNFPGYLERTSVLDFVGAASSRDRFNSRLEAAPTGVFFSNLGLPDKRINF